MRGVGTFGDMNVRPPLPVRCKHCGDLLPALYDVVLRRCICGRVAVDHSEGWPSRYLADDPADLEFVPMPSVTATVRCKRCRDLVPLLADGISRTCACKAVAVDQVDGSPRVLGPLEDREPGPDLPLGLE